MAVIDVGPEAIERLAEAPAGYTDIAEENPANLSGTITKVQVYVAAAMTGFQVGIFHKTDTNDFECSAYAEIGGLTTGYHELEVSLAIEAGDYIGAYWSTGYIERTNAGDGYWWLNSDEIPCESKGFTFTANRTISLKGIGETVVVGWTGKISGVTNPAKIMGVDVANIAKVKGVVSS